jgi:phosphoribosylformylglycinamidine (FGAM) synthase-like enzyme
MVKLAKAGVLASAIDLSAGGLMRAACRIAFATFESSGKMPSLALDIAALGKGLADTLLLGETAHSYLVAVSDTNAAALEREQSAEFPVVRLGEVLPGAGRLKISNTEIDLLGLYAAWANGLRDFFR